MTKETVISLREKLNPTSEIMSPLVVIGDNQHVFHSYKEILVWDDNNELLYSFSFNTDYTSGHKLPNAVRVLTYSDIQYMGTYLEETRTKTLLETLKTDGVINDIQIESILENLRKNIN